MEKEPGTAETTGRNSSRAK
jgi:hypothetical protein